LALSAATVWECRTTGTATAGGGFVAGSTGTDFSQQDAPRIAVSDAVAKGHEDGSAFFPVAGAFVTAEPEESVDYAVMENTTRAAVVPVAMGWSDIGNWQALRDARSGDADGNRTRGEVELVDCRNVLAETDGPRISVIGLEDIAVVVDGDEVLVTTMAGAQKVGKLGGAVNQ